MKEKMEQKERNVSFESIWWKGAVMEFVRQTSPQEASFH